MSVARRARAKGTTTRPGPPPGRERRWVAVLLVAHVALAVWGAARQSVTFDENFHLPAGVMAAARGELRISAVNPPLVKALAGAAALAAGARVPADAALGSREQGEVGVAFMRANADRYQRVFFAGRMVIVLCSLVLLLVVWRWSRRLWGPSGGLVSLAFAAFAPEALAHAGVVTLDVPTALGFTASLATWQVFVTRGRWRDWLGVALAVGFAFNVRFTAVFLAPLLAALLVVQVVRRRARHPRRAIAGLGLLVLSTLGCLQIGYLGRTSWTPLRELSFESRAFQGLQRALPGLRLPLPDAYVGGFDRQSVESQAKQTASYLLGKEYPEIPLLYFPIALAVKWPLGFLAALAALLAHAVVVGRRRARLVWPLSQAMLFLVIGMFIGRLGIGIRYLYPMIPALAVGLGSVASGRAPGAAGFGASPRWRQAIVALAAVQAIEACAHAPWHLSFFNALAGGPERAQFIVNDSNIDWGQGLIALREEMAKRGIHRVYLTYHGTTDPALYGIDNVPYLGGLVGHECDWIAISSYYFVGLTQRMMLHDRRTDWIKIDCRQLWPRRADATPAGCMLLYRLR